MPYSSIEHASPRAPSPPASRWLWLGTALLAATVAVGFAPRAHADWDCGKRERAPTSAEAEFGTRSVGAMLAAFNSPPPGWAMRYERASGVPKTICTDFKDSPITYGVTVRVFQHSPVDVQRAARVEANTIDAEARALADLPPESQAKVTQLRDKASAARAESRQAERAGNKDLAKAKLDEYNASWREIEAIESAHSKSVSAKRTELYQRATKIRRASEPKAFSILLNVNASVQPADRTTFVYGSNAKANQSTTKPLRVTMRIEGDPDDAQLAVLKAMVDTNKLKAMLTALPSVEESKVTLDSNQAVFKESIAQMEAAQQQASKDAEAARQAASAAKSPAPPPAAAAANAPAPANTPATNTASTAPAPSSTPPAPASAPAANPPAPAGKSPAEAAKQATDAVNKLRGLFGR